MTVLAGEYKSRVGLDSLYIAVVSEDSATAYTVGTPAYLAPVAEMSLEPTTNIETQYADDTVFDVMTSEGETKITLSVTNYDLATMATLLGKAYDVAKGEMYDNNATPPYCALGFRSLKSNGAYRYFWFYKGRFQTPGEEFTTKGETPEPKAVELVYTGIYTIFNWTVGAVTDPFKSVQGDSDIATFVATAWFTTVRQPSYSAPSALALSTSTPVDDAITIGRDANITLTFNNALVDDAVYMAALIATVAGSTVASAITLDATKKIITINPTASLGDAVDYSVIFTVEDIYGQHLPGVITFTSTSVAT